MSEVRAVALVFTVVMAVGALLAPASYATHGQAGVEFVVLAAITILLSVGISAAALRAFDTAGRPLAGLLAAMLFRLTMPLALVLAVASFGRAHFAVSTVLYVVPLYLAMLAAETAVVLWHVKAAGGRLTPTPHSSSTTTRSG
jgi:hypothetical protein